MESVQAVNAVQGRSAADIFGDPDELKFRACLSLFVLAAAVADKTPFQRGLDKYFDGESNPLTVQTLGRI